MANAQAQSRVSCWVNTLNESLELINTHYGTNMEVEKYEPVQNDYLDDGTDAQFNG